MGISCVEGGGSPVLWVFMQERQFSHSIDGLATAGVQWSLVALPYSYKLFPVERLPGLVSTMDEERNVKTMPLPLKTQDVFLHTHYELYNTGNGCIWNIPPPPKLPSFSTATCSDFTNNISWPWVKFPCVRLPCIFLLILLTNSSAAKGELVFRMTWQTQLRSRDKRTMLHLCQQSTAWPVVLRFYTGNLMESL